MLPDGFGREAIEYRSISGGALFQEADRLNAEGDNPKNWQLVAGEPADEATLRDLEFAWRALRAPKSMRLCSPIMVPPWVSAWGRLTAWIRANSRLNAPIYSAEKARSVPAVRLPHPTLSSPFADGLQVLLDAGIRAVVHPGGSIRDDEVVQARRMRASPCI